MKKIILAVFLGAIMSSSAYAGEEIQLAAVMGESGSSTLAANKKLYAVGDGRSSGGFSYRNKESNFDYAIIGAVAVGLLAVIVEGGSDSTSNH